MKIKQIILSTVFMLIISSVIVYAPEIEECRYGQLNVRLSLGWNLIYGFVHPDQIADFLDTKHIKAIYALIPTTQQYASFYPEVDRNIQHIDDDILINTATWVYLDKEEGERTYCLKADIIPFEERPLSRGWNLFGMTQDMINILIDSGSCTIEKMAGWDSYQKKWTVIDAHTLSDATLSQSGTRINWWTYVFAGLSDNSQDIGKGIAIKVTNECKLSRLRADPPPLPNNYSG